MPLHGTSFVSLHSVAICTDVLMCEQRMHSGCLRAIILTKTDRALTVETVGPEAVELDIALRQLSVSDQEPGTEDTLGKDIKDSVANDLGVNAQLARTVGKTPDTRCCQYKVVVGGNHGTHMG